MRNSILKSHLKKFIRNEAFVSVIIVFVLAIGIIGTSYALYMDVDLDTQYQLVKVGDLSVAFDGGDSTFTLNYLTPTDDDIATGKVESDISKEISENNFFSFYIYNNGNYTANYNIKLLTQEGSINANYLRYQICKDNIENCKDIQTLGEATDFIIYNDELNPSSEDTSGKYDGGSAYYFLRVWVSSDYQLTENNANKVILKIGIDAKSASGYLDNDNTLAGKLLSDERVKINNTIPSFTGIADYVVPGDSTSGELGLFKAEDDYGISYYYRGAQSYNYVNFAGFTWRVVRINGDGTIRLILDGALNDVCADYEKNSSGNCTKYAGTMTFYNTYGANNAYVGYMYGLALTDTTNIDQERCLKLNESDVVTDYISDYSTQETCESNGGKWTTNSYEATHANVKDSTIKTNVDLFYETYIENDSTNIHYEKYLADTLFCNDKSMGDNSFLTYDTKYGFGQKGTYYAAVERLLLHNNLLNVTNAYPSLKCVDEAKSDYSKLMSRLTSNLDTSTTLSNGTIINNDLKHPIALLSADEVVLAGAWRTTNNNSYYLSGSDSSWVMTPASAGSASRTCVPYYGVDFQYGSIGTIVNPDAIEGVVLHGHSVRPVLNLKADVLYKTGDGTSETPYEIK